MSLSVIEFLQHILKEIEWKDITGMRDKLIHEYFGIDYELVWDVIQNEIPDLRTQIEKIINQEKK